MFLSILNVRFLKTNSGKKGEGMPVVRNQMFYFKEGFCWSDINTTFLKCRKKNKSIHDVKSMTLFSKVESVPEYYIISIINSSFISYYVSNFLNNTQTFQINDARMLPIIVPSEKELIYFKKIFQEAYSHQIIKQKKQYKRNNEICSNLNIQETLDNAVNSLYLQML